MITKFGSHTKKPLSNNGIIPMLSSYSIEVPHDRIEFDYGWKNGKIKALQPLSFDLMGATNIKKKAREWYGTIKLLDQSKELSDLFILIGKPSIKVDDIQKAYTETKEILQSQPNNFEITIIEENEANQFAARMKPIIEKDISHK